MKNFVWLILLCVGCSSNLKIYTDYDRAFDLHSFKTYQWATQIDIEQTNNPLYYNELTDKRIKSISDKQLRMKGFSLTDADPDVIIHYHIVVSDRYSLATDPYGFYGPYWMRPGGNAVLYLYKEGILILDIMDRKTNSLVWRGYAVSVIHDDRREISEATLNKAIIRIFQRYDQYNN